MFPERFSNLPAYAFPRLRSLLDGYAPGGPEVHMTIGEPKHAFPPWVMDKIAAHAEGFGDYPVNEGAPGLLRAQSEWLGRRYGVDIGPDQILALNGTREGLYNAMMALCPETKHGAAPKILVPNPFYQVYMVAALSVGAEPVFLPATSETGHLPDFTAVSEDVLRQTAVAYLCSPSNPQGAVASRAYWRALIELAETYDFKVFADECYSEIYRDTPPVGAMQVAQDMNADPERVVIFHSLSKRSNLPGLRSGFVAGGPETIARLRQLRSYAGTPLPMPLQHAAEAVWDDEAHVVENRSLYQEKYTIADEIFSDVAGYMPPEAGFFLWLPVEDGEAATIKLWCETGVRVLPGAYLSNEAGGINPGKAYIRVAMVAPKEETGPALERLKACLYA